MQIFYFIIDYLTLILGIKRSYKIKNGNQNKVKLHAEISKAWLAQTYEQYNWDEYDVYDNPAHELYEELIEEIVEDEFEKSSLMSFTLIWNKLNKYQKTLSVYFGFEGQVDNGGIYQFFFNVPEHKVSFLEACNELGLTKLKELYQESLNDFNLSKNSYNKRKRIFNDESIEWSERYGTFSDGRKEINNSSVLEDYFFSDANKKEIHLIISNYIYKNLSKFAKIK